MHNNLPDRAALMALAANRSCSMARALDVLGDVWSFLVLRELFFGQRRFDDIQHRLSIARTSLSGRLKRLAHAGLIERVQYSDRPARFEYRLKDKGLALYPAIISLMHWGDRWHPRDSGPPLLLRHQLCRRSLETRLVCSVCRQNVVARDVMPEAGASFDEIPGGTRNATRTHANSDLYRQGRDCSVADALVVIGDRWSFQILRAAFFGVRRFEDFMSVLPLARNVLTLRLGKLVAEQIFVRQEYQVRPPRFDYVLTKKGAAFYDSCLLLIRWGDEWTSSASGPPLRLRHRTCGQHFVPELVCVHCDKEIVAKDVTYADRDPKRST